MARVRATHLLEEDQPGVVHDGGTIGVLRLVLAEMAMDGSCSYGYSHAPGIGIIDRLTG